MISVFNGCVVLIFDVTLPFTISVIWSASKYLGSDSSEVVWTIRKRLHERAQTLCKMAIYACFVFVYKMFKLGGFFIKLHWILTESGYC